jgi:hypothetical protein
VLGLSSQSALAGFVRSLPRGEVFVVGCSLMCMNTIELPKQLLTGFSAAPPLDEWQARLENMNDDEVEKHRVFAIGCLAQDIASQSWAPHIGVAEKILALRKEGQ